MRDNKRTLSKIRRTSQTGLLLYCILFICICLTPLLGLLSGLDSPNLEKRTLAQKPSLTIDGKINQAYTSQFDAYFTDQFTFRSWLIGGWHSINQMLLQRSGSSRVIAGKGGWLFYQDTLDDYLCDPVLDAADLKRLDRVLLLQQQWLASQGIPFLFVLVPNKSTIYPEMMPDRYRPIRSEGNLERWLNIRSSVSQINLTSILRDESQAHRQTVLYHQTDSHWNNLGAALAADALLTAMQNRLPELSADSLSSQGWQSRQDWEGDLAVMLYPSGPVPDWQHYLVSPEPFRYVRPIKSLEDIKILTTAQNGRYQLLMFRDSFANALIPLLSPRFAQVTYSRAFPYDYSLVVSSRKASANNPQTDLVVLEIVERNLPLLLETPPRMPASLMTADEAAELSKLRMFSAESGSAADAAAGQLVALAGELDRNWLKLTGAWHDSTDSSAIDRVAVGFTSLTDYLMSGSVVATKAGLPVAFLEAFPICSPADRGHLALPDATTTGNSAIVSTSGGFTLYLEPGQWQAGEQDLVVAAHGANGWQTSTARVTLP